LYIERENDVLASAWRVNYRVGETTPYKTTIIARNVPFEKAWEKAIGFVEWMKKKQKYGR